MSREGKGLLVCLIKGLFLVLCLAGEEDRCPDDRTSGKMAGCCVEALGELSNLSRYIA